MEKLILILKYIVIALVQGFAEILPISSSGHLVVFEQILGLEEEGLAFEVFLHFASLIAIIFFFRKRLIELIRDFFAFIFKRNKNENKSEEELLKYDHQKNNFMYCIYIVIATIPVGIVGVALKDIIDEYLNKVWIVGICLIVTAIGLFVSTRIKRTTQMKDMKWYDALVIGLFQCFGSLPGISRSGSCIVGASSRKINQNDAAEFAFILAIPVMFGSAVFMLDDFAEALKNTSLILPYIIAFLVTLFSTYFCLKFFLAIVRKQKLTYFSIYCLIAGITFIILYFTGVLA